MRSLIVSITETSANVSLNFISPKNSSEKSDVRGAGLMLKNNMISANNLQQTTEHALESGAKI